MNTMTKTLFAAVAFSLAGGAALAAEQGCCCKDKDKKMACCDDQKPQEPAKPAPEHQH